MTSTPQIYSNPTMTSCFCLKEKGFQVFDIIQLSFHCDLLVVFTIQNLFLLYECNIHNVLSIAKVVKL